MMRFAFVLCTFLSVIPAMADDPVPVPPPTPLVTGKAVALQPAVTGLKVVSSNWPDATSLADFGRDAARIEHATTDEQRAIACWRWMRRCTTFTGSGPPCEPGQGYLSDPNLVLNVYAAHHCDGLSRLTAAIWRASRGLPAVKLYRAGHTMSELWWIDSDGVGRYHMFDNNYGYFLYDRSGSHIVSADDIGADFSLEALPSGTLRPWIEKQWWMWAWIHTAWPEPDPYDGTMNLHAGESVRRLWGNVGVPFYANLQKGPRELDDGVYPMDFGNGVFAWSEDFASDAWRGRLAVESANAKAAGGELGQADAAAPAEVVYRGRFPYVVADVALRLAFGHAGDAAVETSIDGGRSWATQWQGQADPASPKDISLARLLPPTHQPAKKQFDRRTAIGRYDYLLRLRLGGGATLRSIGCVTTVQLNHMVLPNLIPGDNAITVSGQLAAGQAVEVTYLFDDVDGKGKRSVAVADNLPFRYTIQAAGRRWADVQCRSVTVRAVPADGRGSRVVEAPAAAKVLPDGGMAELDYRVLNALVPEAPGEVQDYAGRTPMTEAQARAMKFAPPRLRTTAEYVKDLASPDEDTRRFAAAGLIVLRDPAAWAPLMTLAESDVTRAKYYAIQALFWTDAKRAWPMMAAILRRDASVKYAPDVEGKTEAPTNLNLCAMVAALAGRAKIAEAVPLIAAAMVREGKWWEEPRWAMIRALGRIGDPSAMPIVRRYVNSGSSDKRVVAINAAADLGDREVVPLIEKYLEAKGWNLLPDATMGALTRLRAEGYTDRVVPHLGSDRADRRWLAADYLAECGQPDKALPPLRAALEKEMFAYARERMQRAIDVLSAGGK
ncbi:MAG: hypothetical protein BIFFINMI_00095 [Phycisphaerae bacterium]|nr:hypothetical protein [Phycisphaerae bacterium]